MLPKTGSSCPSSVYASVLNGARKCQKPLCARHAARARLKEPLAGNLRSGLVYPGLIIWRYNAPAIAMRWRSIFCTLQHILPTRIGWWQSLLNDYPKCIILLNIYAFNKYDSFFKTFAVFRVLYISRLASYPLRSTHPLSILRLSNCVDLICESNRA